MVKAETTAGSHLGAHVHVSFMKLRGRHFETCPEFQVKDPEFPDRDRVMVLANLGDKFKIKVNLPSKRRPGHGHECFYAEVYVDGIEVEYGSEQRFASRQSWFPHEG